MEHIWFPRLGTCGRSLIKFLSESKKTQSCCLGRLSWEIDARRAEWEGNQAGNQFQEQRGDHWRNLSPLLHKQDQQTLLLSSVFWMQGANSSWSKPEHSLSLSVPLSLSVSSLLSLFLPLSSFFLSLFFLLPKISVCAHACMFACVNVYMWMWMCAMCVSVCAYNFRFPVRLRQGLLLTMTYTSLAGPQALEDGLASAYPLSTGLLGLQTHAASDLM